MVDLQAAALVIGSVHQHGQRFKRQITSNVKVFVKRLFYIHKNNVLFILSVIKL